MILGVSSLSDQIFTLSIHNITEYEVPPSVLDCEEEILTSTQGVLGV